MAKNVDVNVNVQDNAGESIARLKELRQEIKNVSIGSEDFRKLRSEMDDIEDSLKSGKTAAGNFTDVLGTIPGPIGDIGAKASSTIDTLKGLGKLKVTDLKASFISLKDDVVSAAKGLANLSGVTKVYTVVQNALAGAFLKTGVAEGVAATGAKAFAAALTATGIGALIVGLGLAVTALMAFINAEDESAKSIRETNEALADQKKIRDEVSLDMKRVAKVNIEEMKKNGATEAQIRKQMIEDAMDEEVQAEFDLADTRKKANENKLKLQKDYSKEANEQRQKLDDEILAAENRHQDAIANTKILGFQDQAATAKEKYDQEQKDIADAAKKKEEAYTAEVEANRKKYQLLIDDAKIAGKDTTEFEIKKAEALVKIQKKYGKDSFDAAQEAKLKKDALADKEKEDMINLQKEINDALVNTDAEREAQAIAAEQEKFKKLIDNVKTDAEQRVLLETALQENILKIKEEYGKKGIDDQKQRDANALNDKMILNQLIIDDERNGYERRLAAVTEKEALIRSAIYESEAQRTADLKANSDLRQQIELEAYIAKQEITMGYLGLASQVGTILQDIAGENKKVAIAGVVIEKAAAIGQIIASTAIANAKAVAALPLTLGQPWVAINTASAILSSISVGISAGKAIQEINKADTGGDSGGDGGGSSVKGSKFGKGGLLTGRSHANGGIMTPMGELEGGEYVINRASTQSFLPLLESINSLGVGIDKFQGNLSSSVENQNMGSGGTVVKAYVVASDMTSQQEANKRISDLARL